MVPLEHAGEQGEFSCDHLFGDALRLYQERRGYRFSIDAVLLCGLTRVKAGDRIMELGTGCGVVLLAMAARHRGVHWEGVEIQERLAALARRNVDANGLSGRVTIHCMDWKEVPKVFPPGGFDLIVSNPPYRRVHAGRVNPEPQKATARHELAGTVWDMFQAASYLLKFGGRCAVIYPASRLDDLVLAAVEAGLRTKRMTFIHSHLQAPATLVHVECGKGAGPELRVTAPFYIYETMGRYTPEMARIHTGIPAVAEPD